MNDVLITIAISIITNGTLLGLFIWVFKRLFDSALTKRTEQFKQELDLINKKYFYQYSKLYDEQAQVIKEVYADLVDIFDRVGYLVYHYKLLENYPEYFKKYRVPENDNSMNWEEYVRTSILSEREENIKSQELYERASVVLKEFKMKRIYLSRETADKIEHLTKSIMFIAHEFKVVTYRDPYKFEPVVAQELIDAWCNSVIVSDKLFPVLEESFRKHIGLNELEK